MKKQLFLAILLISSFSIKAQINTQGVLSNEQALLVAEQDGYQTINIPILSRYVGITESQADILQKLKSSTLIDYTVVDPVNQIVDTQFTFKTKDFIAAQTKQGEITKTYLAIALVEVDDVLEVRQHQTKNNAQTVDYQFRILDLSQVGTALKWFKVNSTLKHTVDYINTSNGWKKDLEDRNDVSITNYKSSRYGPTGLSNYQNKLKDIEFVKNIRTNIIGRWDRSTKKEKRNEYYIFNEDGNFEHYLSKKDQTTIGKYKYSTNFGDKIHVSIIPREGKNKNIRLQRSQTGMYIDGKPYRKEGSATSATINKEDPIEEAENVNKILEAKKLLYSKNLQGFWKSSNGKITLDVKEEKKLVLKTKKEEYNNASYDLTILDDKLFLIVFDKDLLEVFNEELKVVRDDQMILGGKSYVKF